MSAVATEHISTTPNDNPVTFNFKNAELKRIPLKLIMENSDSLRPVVDKNTAEYKGLADSVKRNGVMNAITVRPITDPVDGTQKYGLIDGLHRYNAAMDAGLEDIPAQVGDLQEADLLEAQIIANVQKIETTPVQYTKALLRILAANPTMTVGDLCVRIKQDTDWFYKRLGLLKLNDDIKVLVDNGTLILGNAYVLSQFDKDRQNDFLQQAISKSATDFKNTADAALKEIRKAKKEGREENIDVFTPHAKLRRLPELKEEVDYITEKPEASKLLKEAEAAGVKTINEAIAFGIKYAMNLNPSQVEVQKNLWEKERQESKEKAEAKAKEREEKKRAKALNGVV